MKDSVSPPLAHSFTVGTNSFNCTQTLQLMKDYPDLTLKVKLIVRGDLRMAEFASNMREPSLSNFFKLEALPRPMCLWLML